MIKYVTYHKLIDLLQSVQEASPRMKSFAQGDIVYFADSMSGNTIQYPLMFVTPLAMSYDENTTTYQMSIIFADIVHTDLSNEVDVVTDMELEARNLLSQIKRGTLIDKVDCILPATSTPFFERFNDHVGGVVLDVSLVVFEDINACEAYPSPSIPVSPTPTPTVTPSTSVTPTPTCPTTTQYLRVEIFQDTKLKWSLWNDAGFTSTANALCNYSVSGTIIGTLGTNYQYTETIVNNDHNHQHDFAGNLQLGETIAVSYVSSVNTSTCVCPVVVNFGPYITPTPTPTPTSSVTPSITPTITPTITPSVSITPSVTTTPTPTPSGSVWTPASFANLYDWWTADAGVGLSGSNVTGWTGYNSNVLSPFNGTYPATYSSSDAAFNNEPSITLNPTKANVDAGYTVPVNGSASNGCVIVIGKLLEKQTGDFNPIFSNTQDVGRRYAVFGMNSSSEWLWYTQQFSPEYTITGTGFTDGNYVIIRVDSNISAGTTTYYQSTDGSLTNQVEQLSGDTNVNFNQSNLILGGYNNVSGKTPKMSVVEFIKINALPSGAEITNMENYISTKYGL